MMNDNYIKEWETIEDKYYKIISSKLDEFIKNSKVPLRKMIFSSKIIACSNGLFLIREAYKNNSPCVITSVYLGDAEEARKELNLNKLEHVRISNNVMFYSLDYYEYEFFDKYDATSEAENDFELITSNDNLLDNLLIKTVDDAIETVINANFDRGQLIFRGQINAKWPLIPKLFRDYPVEAEGLEIALFETLLSGLKSPYLNTFDPIELLMNSQHFGIPTRLLDWTSDILIALFFACYDEKGEFVQEDGNLFMVERQQYAPFKINSIENNSFNQPFNKDTIDLFKKRCEIKEIHVFEPIIKNPRIRIQDGCFMFFPFLSISLDERKYISLEDFISAKNNYIEQSKSENEMSKLWRGFKKIDKNFKQAILHELEEKHGISKQTIFVEIPHVTNVSKYYLGLYEKAKAKAKAIWLKSQRKQ